MSSTSETKAPKVPQEYWDENRERFNAETTITEGEPPKCKHYFRRVSATEIYCKKCRVGWIDMGKFEVKNGRILKT